MEILEETVAGMGAHRPMNKESNLERQESYLGIPGGYVSAKVVGEFREKHHKKPEYALAFERKVDGGFFQAYRNHEVFTLVFEPETLLPRGNYLRSRELVIDKQGMVVSSSVWVKGEEFKMNGDRTTGEMKQYLRKVGREFPGDIALAVGNYLSSQTPVIPLRTKNPVRRFRGSRQMHYHPLAFSNWIPATFK